MTLVEELLRQKVDEVFLECQHLRHIDSGDITPNDLLTLDTLIEDLSKHITKVLDFQTPEYDDVTTLEVLEDFHTFKRGEVVFAVEETDKHYVVESGVVLVYTPKHLCRKMYEEDTIKTLSVEEVLEHIKERPFDTFLLDIGAPRVFVFSEYMLDNDAKYYIKGNIIHLYLE